MIEGRSLNHESFLNDTSLLPPPPPPDTRPPLKRRKTELQPVQGGTAHQRTDGNNSSKKSRLLNCSGQTSYAQQPNPCGTWYVISCCDSVGGAWLALKIASVPNKGISIENDHELRQFLAYTWPEHENVSDIRSIEVDKIIGKFRSSNCCGIFRVGGPPCKSFSAFGNQRGFEDANAEPLMAFVNLKRALEKVCKENGIHWRWMMEEVASMSKENRDRISQLLEATPCLIEGADWGFVHRARLYWGLLENPFRPMEQFELFEAGTLIDGVAVLRWKGGQTPRTWQPESGWEWPGRDAESSYSIQIPGSDHTTTFTGGRFMTMTTCFPHKPDRGVNNQEEGQMRRFEDDQGRFPLPITHPVQCIAV